MMSSNIRQIRFGQYSERQEPQRQKRGIDVGSEPTEPQLAKIHALGGTVLPRTKREASRMIDDLIADNQGAR